MTHDIVRAAERLAREADDLADYARSAAEARALIATWPAEVSTSATLVERVADAGMRRKVEDVVMRARGLVAAAEGTPMGEAIPDLTVDPVDLLRERISAAGSQVAWARAHGLGASSVSDTLALRRPPSRGILHALGLKAIVTTTYRRTT